MLNLQLKFGQVKFAIFMNLVTNFVVESPTISEGVVTLLKLFLTETILNLACFCLHTFPLHVIFQYVTLELHLTIIILASVGVKVEFRKSVYHLMTVCVKIHSTYKCKSLWAIGMRELT